MSIVNNYKKVNHSFFNLVLIFNILVLVSFVDNKLINLEQQTNNFISKQKPHLDFELKLDTISSFKWDELLVAGPYTYLKDIKGYNFRKFPDFATEHDEDIFLGFILENKGVKWVRLKEYKLFKTILVGGNHGYKTYSKKECIFILRIE